MLYTNVRAALHYLIFTAQDHRTSHVRLLLSILLRRPYITLQLGEFSSRVCRIFAYVGCVALLSVVIAALPVLFCLNRLPVGNGNHRKSERRRILRCIKAWRAWLYPLHPRQEESSSASLRPSFTKYLVYQRKKNIRFIPLIVVALPFPFCNT